MKTLIPILIWILLLLAGCAVPTATSVPTETPSQTASLTPSITVTLTPSLTPSLTPTPLPTATPTAALPLKEGQPLPEVQPISKENLGDLKLVRKFDLPPTLGLQYKYHYIQNIGFSPNGNKVLLSYYLSNVGGLGELLIWNASDGKLAAQLAGSSYRYSSDGSKIALYYYRDKQTSNSTVYDDQEGFLLEVWDVVDDIPQTRLKTLYSVTNPMAFIQDDQSLVAMGNRDLRIFRLSDWKLTSSVPANCNLKFSPAGNSYMCVSRGITFFLDLLTGRQLLPDGLEADRLGVFSTDGELYAAPAGWEKPVAVWDLSTGERISTIIHIQIQAEMSFTPDGSMLIIPGMTEVLFYRTSDGEPLGLIPIEMKPVDLTWKLEAAISPDGKWIAVAYQAGAEEPFHIELWAVP